MPSLLAIATHPDDEAYSFAATNAAASRAGWRITLLCVSDGEKGKRHDGGPGGPAELGRARRTEFERSGALLGVSAVRFLGVADGAVRAGRRHSRRLVRGVSSGGIV